MASLHRYINGEGFYLKHSFKTNGRIFHVTYQVSDQAELILMRNGYKDNDRVPKPLVIDLERKGLIFTNQSGVTPERVRESDRSENKTEPFMSLSSQAQEWVLLRAECHPKCVIKTRQLADKGLEVSYQNLPDQFFNQLTVVAKRFDGTEFLQHLDKSYSSKTYIQSLSDRLQ